MALSIKVEGIGMNPKLEVEVNRFHDGKVNYATLKISELEIELDEATYIALFEKMDFAMWDETKENLEAKVDELSTQISKLEDELADAEAAASYEPEEHYGFM